MPGFTHTQHAQPTTLAHYLLAYEAAFSRDFQRLREALSRVNCCPLGAAAFASTCYPIDRELTARLLGFDAVLDNTMDAVSSRDFALEVLSDLAVMMAGVSRLCEDLVAWSSWFIRFVELDDAFCSTSSIMPQKKNPDTAEVMRAKAASVLGSCTSAFATMKALPQSYNRDLQELTPSLWRGVRDAKHSTRLLVDLLDTAAWDTVRMREEAGRGFSTVTDLADLLVRKLDLPFRTAHTIVGLAVQKGSVDIATLDTAAEEAGQKPLSRLGLTSADIAEALDVERSVDRRRARGGPSEFAVKISIGERRNALKTDQEMVDALVSAYSGAIQRLIADARKVSRE